jgi:hypothetical protein
MKAKSLKQTRDEIEKQLQNLNVETLKLLAADNAKAQEYIKIGQELTGAEKLTDAQTKSLATEMQAIARMELEVR